MNIDIILNQQDWMNFNRYVVNKVQNEIRGRLNVFVSNLIFLFIVGFAMVIIFGEGFHLPSVACTALLFSIVFFQLNQKSKKLVHALCPNENGTFVGKHNFIFERSGISSYGNGYKSYHDKSTFKEIIIEQSYIMIFIDTATALLFPINQIKELEKLKEIIAEYYS